MICPRCSEDDDKVVDSRSSDGGHVVRRRRECNHCGMRFTTYERCEATGRLVVVKRDGSRVPFNRENVMRGLRAACGKRPVSEETKEELVNAVERELRREFDREVPSIEIGKRLALHLKGVDGISYIRYASEYHNFTTIDDIASEVSNLQAQPPDDPGQDTLFEE